MFKKLLELGSVRQSLLWFLEHGLELPRYTTGEELRWRRPSYNMLYNMLTHPAYGGAYAYGKTEQTTRYEGGESHQVIRRKPREQWLSFIAGAHEGYVSWEEFERIQTTISENLRGSDHMGAAQRGPALRPASACRRCGHKLVVHYTGNHHDVLRYQCCGVSSIMASPSASDSEALSSIRRLPARYFAWCSRLQSRLR